MKIGSYGYVAEHSNRSKAKWVIYHNPKCSKSSEALELLWQNRIEPEIIEYLETPLTKQEVENLLALFQGDPKDIVRTNEKVFSTLKIDLTKPEEIAEAIAKHPILLERPIIVYEGRAFVARPPEKVLELLPQ